MRAEVLLFKGMTALREGRPDEAYEYFEKATQDAGTSALAMAWMGHIKSSYFRSDAEAEELFKASMDKDATLADTYLFYAELLFRHERFAEMNAVINKASVISGVARDKVNHLHGLLSEAQGRFDEAISFYKKAILTCFDNTLLSVYESAINRCMVKQKYV
jgi:tetratricopeptide (TPR) repeat protein